MPTEALGSSRSIWLSILGSFALALVVFLVFVLPAEFARDPTGLGKFLGIQGMSGFEVSALTLEAKPPLEDVVEFPLAPFESVEYKYELASGQAVVYSWQASGEVLFDFHSEEVGTDPEDSISFSTGRGESENGTFVAPFAGRHGWFWENRGTQDVRVKLQTSGFSPASITYGAKGEFRREL